MWKLKATTNNPAAILQTGENSEGLIRAVEPLPTYRVLGADAMEIDEIHSWTIAEDCQVIALRLLFPDAPTGTLSVQVERADGTIEADFSIDVTGAGVATDDAWFFSPVGLFLPSGAGLKISCSQAADQLMAWLTPVILSPPVFSVS